MVESEQLRVDNCKTTDTRPWALLSVFALATVMCASATWALILLRHAENDLAAYRQDNISAEDWKQQAEKWRQQANKSRQHAEKWRQQAEKWRQQAEKQWQQLKNSAANAKDAAWLRAQWHRDLEIAAKHPYTEVTGAPALQLPRKYGIIPEKTIWLYWYHPQTCPNSMKCVLSPKRQLLLESIIHNKGNFHVELVHKNQVEEFVNDVELPFRWRELLPELQQAAVMNALLARYGGVALDLCTCLLRPLDDYWDEMVANGASFRGYLFRLNGKPWWRAEAVADWFLMGRREGIFSSA
eukprot:CAMPEP_0172671972 /NCGR_PEP_ID=MMETSP1074-20121228/11255_1 /TAXON_ID=2916 /ORGANISM="Ceratium fusus, Strain PA161109" /LENGTH=296 /DNA_ID=CAMNT_0013489093 /DNA_START=58 /DNA_END=944 /DNA_ORIENTATION=+